MRNTMRFRLAGIGLTLLAGAFWGCSHTSPYYHADLGPPDESCVGVGDIRFRVLLVGDAGDTEVSAATLACLTEWASQIPDKTCIVFLGDNIYPVGMPAQDDPQRWEAEQRLRAQLAVVQKSDARAIFIPRRIQVSSATHGCATLRG